MHQLNAKSTRSMQVVLCWALIMLLPFILDHVTMSDRKGRTFKYGILTIRNFYGELSVRTINCLKNIDVEFLDELAKTSKKELLRTRNLGKKSIDELADLMHKHGLYFQK